MSEMNLDDTMNEVLEDIQSREDDFEEQEEQEEQPEQETQSGRDRDERGRFASKAQEQEQEQDPELTEPTEPLEEVQGEVAEAPEVDESIVNPPTTWRAGSKAKWASIDPEIRAEIHKRESDMREGVRQMRDRAEFGDKLDAVIRPYQPTLRAKNVTAEQATEVMLNAYYVLETAAPEKKAEQLIATAQQYGVLNHIVARLTNGQAPMQQPQPGITPEQVEQIVQKRLSEVQEQQTSQTLGQEVAAFQTAKNEDGTLKHPYFENVRGLMASILEADATGEMSLEDAYENACWSSRETRSVLQQQQNHSAQAESHAEKAKKANANNLRKRPSHQGDSPETLGSVDDTLKETLSKIKARSA